MSDEKCATCDAYHTLRGTIARLQAERKPTPCETASYNLGRAETLAQARDLLQAYRDKWHTPEPCCQAAKDLDVMLAELRRHWREALK